ncbi:hypothetical protein [Cellulosimicrobium sp. TH-20]|uniref:8-oxoguanine DNA glycosylase OGG fold protein n=1 Tax=Cellulosimicrobium sp. TH-20 TaxID=1980001 RepID=UPI0011A7BE0A|nr:hypothetical protein [Cellulosimicrobium sp. TH-20]
MAADPIPVPDAVASLLARPALTSVRARPNLESWSRWLIGLEGAQAGLDAVGDEIDRSRMCELTDAFITDGEIVSAFVVTMVWGYGGDGRGPFRTRRVLTGSDDPQDAPLNDEVVGRLSLAVDVARRDGAVEGYRYLNRESLGRIKHLGPAFFTKWLYAATARGDRDHEHAAPVLDERVLRWINEKTDLRLRHSYTDDYAAYIGALERWGRSATPQRTTVDVEEAIFNQTGA